MSKKPPPPPSLPLRYVFWIGCKLLVAVSVLLWVLSLLRHRSLSDSRPSSFSVPRRSRAFPRTFDVRPRIAFLFLARRDLPLDFVWGSFFENADPANLSVYVHSEPGFAFDESTSRSHFFYGRQLRNSVKVVWGEASMIEAERLLLEEALLDPANQRFVLLSDSCVPLYNFTYIYNYLMTSPRSFVDSFLDVKGDRYNPKMSPYIPKNKWRKGSQWITLVRSHAEVIVNDRAIFPVFKNYCKRRPPIDASKGILNIDNAHALLAVVFYSSLNWEHIVVRKSISTPGRITGVSLGLTRTALIKSGPTHDLVKAIHVSPGDALVMHPEMQELQKQHNCIPDEHYVPTLLSMNEIEGELERRTLTYTSWNLSTTNMEKKGWHPTTFYYATAGPKRINEIKGINHVYYQTEFRTEWCKANSTSVPCFLFARKFSKGAAFRLLREGVVGSFDAPALLDVSV